MKPLDGQSGRNVFPCYPLGQDTEPGEWVPFTDGTKRRVAKAEHTVGFGAQGDRYMLVVTIMFDDDESMWQMPPLPEQP